MRPPRSDSHSRGTGASGGRRRYEPDAVYRLAEHVKRRGVDLGSALGPWRAVPRQVRRPGRASLQTIAVITNDRTDLMVESGERAADVAGLLNWCGVHHLDPVPELRPPDADEQESTS